MDLDEVNKEIKRLQNIENVKAWQKANPEKAKELRDKWNRENRKEYQRAYRAKNK